MAGASTKDGDVDYRTRMLRRGPGHPGTIEQARNPRQALARLLPYLGPYRPTLALVLILVLISTALGLAGPYLLGRAIDGYIATGDAAGLATIATWMLAVYLAGNGADVAAGWLVAAVSQKALQSVRRDLFGHTQSLPLRFFDTHSTGELMSRLTNDIEAINTAVSQNVVALLASVLSLVGILVAMFVLNFWLALASVVVVPIMFWFTNFVARYTRKGFRELQRDLGQLNGLMEEAISGQRVIHMFRRSESVADLFREHNEQVYRSAITANSYALLLMPMTNQLGNLFVIAIAGLGGWLALQDLVTVGTIVTFISYGRSFINPVRQLANMYNSIQAALAGAERVFEILDTTPEADVANAVPLGEVAGHVRFDNVRFSYVAGTPVIRNMSLEAQPGQTVALVGPTGAGKTTLVNLLMRFYETGAGEIRIDGTGIDQLQAAELRQQLGMVLQDTFLFSASVMDNIRYGRPEATDDEVIEAARLADADHFIQPPARRLPDDPLGARRATSARDSASCWLSPGPSWPTLRS
jgi:ATP-binding cassette, subfamily B, multidrug efflux pump